jgi:GNAT superfamily N-acetyltransferase
MADRTPTSPDGATIDVRPIQRDELGKVLLRCLPDGGRIETMFRTQGTIGMAAWDSDTCVAQLHGYRLVLPGGSADLWPDWSRPHYIDDILNGSLDITGPVWCHACCHVGRSIESFSVSDAPDSRYFGRGIGTALCRASVCWARENGYEAVIAPGTPSLFEVSQWFGGLPWTTYDKLGFSAVPAQHDDLPDWAKGNCPPDVSAAVEAALAAGRPPQDFHSKLMVLRLKDA